MKHGARTKKKSPGSDGAAVDAYLASLPETTRAGLAKLRDIIASTAPGAQPGISYGIPAFRLNGRPLVWFAAFKHHSSFFPGPGAIRIHASDLKGYKISKGTIQFPPDKPPPPRLIARLIKTRIAELQNTNRRTKSRPQKRSAT